MREGKREGREGGERVRREREEREGGERGRREDGGVSGFYWIFLQEAIKSHQVASLSGIHITITGVTLRES